MSASDDFRKNADECRQFAAKAIKPAIKAGWLTLAENWLKLAQIAEAPPTNQRGEK